MWKGCRQSSTEIRQISVSPFLTFSSILSISIEDIEVETLPGIILGHKNLPVQSVGCYIPAGKFPLVAAAHMSVLTASVAGVPRIIACTPPWSRLFWPISVRYDPLKSGSQNKRFR